MNAYWITAGLGALVVVIGGILWRTTDERLGIMLILGGLVVAALGLVLRAIQWGVDKSKPRSEM